MSHPDATIGITAHHDATSHLPPAGIHGGGCGSLQFGFFLVPTSFSFFTVPIRRAQWHSGPLLRATACRGWVIGEKTQTSGSPSPLYSSFLLCLSPQHNPSLHLHIYTHVKKTQLHKGNEITKRAAWLLKTGVDVLSGWLHSRLLGLQCSP